MEEVPDELRQADLFALQLLPCLMDESLLLRRTTRHNNALSPH